MVDGLPRQSPLAHLGLAVRSGADAGNAGVWLSDASGRDCIVNLRGPATPEIRGIVAECAGCGLPVHELESARHGGMTALWLGPDEWLLTGPTDGAALTARLAESFPGQFVTATDVSDAYAVIGLEGPSASEVLSKGCGLDLHPRAFGPGRVARSLLAQATVILHQTDETAYEIYVRRSYADYLWRWLEDAGAEFGVAIVAN